MSRGKEKRAEMICRTLQLAVSVLEIIFIIHKLSFSYLVFEK